MRANSGGGSSTCVAGVLREEPFDGNRRRFVVTELVICAGERERRVVARIR